MPEKPQSQSLAVLIDADNTSARHAHAIFEEIVKLGEANVRRIYGDFSGTRLAGWNKQIQSLAILQHQQRSDTTGKNASDIALVIDAMDLMHKGKLDGFCLVSSDSDFTRLAQRLREDGLVVYGFGERKTPEAFRSACNRFIYVDNLMEAGADKENGEAASPAAAKKEPPSKAVKIIARAIEDSDDDGWAKSRRRRQPDCRRGAGLRCAHLRVPEPEHAGREIRRFRDQEGAGRGGSYPPQGGRPQGGRESGGRQRQMRALSR